MPIISTLLSILKALTDIQWDKFKKFGEYLGIWHQRNSLYEVLEHNITLELHDENGVEATYYKNQHVRFLQDNVIAYQDTAWGDGEIFIDYQCSPGKAVDWYKEGHRYRILISLRETKQKGDIEEFDISRKIHNGYTEAHNYLQTDIDHRTHQMQMRVIFPKQRFSKSVWITERNTKYTHQIDVENMKTLPDGRYQVTWRKKNPRLQEGYIMSWDW